MLCQAKTLSSFWPIYITLLVEFSTGEIGAKNYWIRKIAREKNKNIVIKKVMGIAGIVVVVGVVLGLWPCGRCESCL